VNNFRTLLLFAPQTLVLRERPGCLIPRISSRISGHFLIASARDRSLRPSRSPRIYTVGVTIIKLERVGGFPKIHR
jgi:hypothetical protein